MDLSVATYSGENAAVLAGAEDAKLSVNKGKYRGFPNSCPGNDKKYSCCSAGDGCIPNVPAAQACCNQDFKEISEVTDFIYDFDSATSSIDPQGSQLEVSFKGTNAGPRPLNIGKVSQTISSTQTTGWTFSRSTQMSVRTKIKWGIPFIAEGSLEVGIKQELLYGNTGSKTSSIAVSVDSGGSVVPPYSRQMFAFKSMMKVFLFHFVQQLH